MRIIMWVLVALFMSACAHQQNKKVVVSNVHEEEDLLKPFYGVDPAIKKYLKKSMAYVVFPRIEKGAVGVGGAFGKGKVYAKGQNGYGLVGTAELKQLSAGLQLGAQTYSEVIFFQTHKAFNKFKRGETTLSAQASVVALKEGKSANTVFKNGVAIIVLKEKGLMGELSVGGQKLSYTPLRAK